MNFSIDFFKSSKAHRLLCGCEKVVWKSKGFENVSCITFLRIDPGFDPKEKAFARIKKLKSEISEIIFISNSISQSFWTEDISRKTRL